MDVEWVFKYFDGAPTEPEGKLFKFLLENNKILSYNPSTETIQVNSKQGYNALKKYFENQVESPKKGWFW